MTSPTNGGWEHPPPGEPPVPEAERPTVAAPTHGWQAPPPPSRHAEWPPPPPTPPPPPAQTFATAQSGSGWATQFVPPSYDQPSYHQPAYDQPAYDQPVYSQPAYDQPAYSQPAYDQPRYAPTPYADGSETPWTAGGSGTPWTAAATGQGRAARRRGKNNKLLFGVIAAVVVAALIGGGLFFFLGGEDITYQGRDVVEPEKVLTDAEATLAGIVEARHGATGDGTACYFVAKNADTTDVEDVVVCGPVLFVDGDVSKPYLTFPLQVSTGNADARITVAAEPEGADPAGLANPDLLRRPDGTSPPDGSGGLAVPDAPRADGGVFAVVPADSLELESTPSNARIGSPTMSVAVSGIGEPGRYGRGDDARRPAEGEKFVGFEITSGPGESGPVGAFSIAVQVGDDDPMPLPDDADLSADPVQIVLSVPEESEDATLIVTEGALVQSLSLTTGEPDPDNVAVWQRANRNQVLSYAQAITIRASQPGFVTEDFPATLVVNQVVLTYFAGPNLDRAPSAPGQAFLVLDAGLNIAGQNALGLDPPYWSTTLPDGTVLAAADLNDDPSLISIAFEVPATFTEGTLTFGGVLTTASGLTFDSLGVVLSIPIAIEAG